MKQKKTSNGKKISLMVLAGSVPVLVLVMSLYKGFEFTQKSMLWEKSDKDRSEIVQAAVATISGVALSALLFSVINDGEA